MANVCVLVEQRDGKLKNSSFEILSASKKAGNKTYALLMGNSISALAPEVISYGADTVYVVEDSALKFYSSDAYSKAAVAALKEFNPDIILASHTPMGRDLMPHIAAAFEVGAAADCTSLEFKNTDIVVRKPVYSGKALVEVEFLGQGPRLATIRPNSLEPPVADKGHPGETIPMPVSLDGIKLKTTGVEKGSTERPDVTEAGVVVSGGRSLKSADGFKLIEELADVLHAGVGASRAAVDAGYRPHRDQVGQTGKVVSPQLYIACGISGAIQHLAGMRTSKVIVAINTDPEAPIFQVADYGIVGDLFEVVPLLTKEFKAAL